MGLPKIMSLLRKGTHSILIYINIKNYYLIPDIVTSANNCIGLLITLINMKHFIFGTMMVAAGFSQQCDLQDQQKVDCGYMGIDQSGCQAKGCCWKPVFDYTEQKLQGTPWCFYPSGQNPCQKIDYDGSKGPGFDDSFYNTMYGLFDANINIQGKGGIVAAPDHSTPGGSYYYHWMRDAALTMRTYMQLNDYNLSKIAEKMKAYVGWVKHVQSETDPNGFDIRINPKFQLPNGEVYVGGWCRPQTDGPGLRSGTLIAYANALLKGGETSYVRDTLMPIIKNDLDWIHTNWGSDGCDLWEQVHSNDFFWNRMSFHYTLGLANKFFNDMGDSSYASKCSSTRSAIQQTLDGHWTGTFMTESSGRQKDTAVIHAFSSFDDAYPITDSKVAKTINVLGMTFCAQYPLNQQDNKAGIPGMLFGRYPGDSYAGGNPWQLLTAVAAKALYQGAQAISESNGFLKAEDKQAWTELLNLPKDASTEEVMKASLSAGDAIMYRLYQHVKSDGGHIAEQISKTSGAQTSAKDLTWSYANILSAMKTRKSAVSAFESMKSVEVE